MENLKNLEKIAKIFQPQNIITSEEIDQVLKGIMEILASYKKGTDAINEETKAVVNILLDKVVQSNKQTLDKAETVLDDRMTDLETLLKDVKQMINDVEEIASNVRDGKDADEEKIVEDVVSRIKLEPTIVTLSAEEVRDRLSSLKDEARLDKSAIKGLDKILQQTDLDYAIATLQQQTSFLINKGGLKVVSHDASLTGDGTPESPLAVAGGGSGITLQTDGTPNGSQTLLNLVEGTNMTITDDGNGNITFDATGGSGSPGGSTTQLQYNNAGAFGGISGATTDGTAVIYTTGNLKGTDIKASTSAGLEILSNNGTVVSLHGAGGGANNTFYGTIKADYATATTVPYLDASKNLISSAVTPTELGYVSGVTSSIQTQLNAKEAALTFSTGLTRSTNTITSNLSTGISGGQSVVGGVAASETLTLSSTSHATKGKILFGTSAYDEVNNRLGIGTASPTYKLHVTDTTTTTSGSDTLLYASLATTTSSSTAAHAAGYFDLSARPAVGESITTGRAAYYQADNDGAGTVSTLYGINTYGRNTSTGTVTNCYGNYSLVQNTNTGSIGTAYGLRGAVENSNTGTITTGQALAVNVSNTSTGTITNAYGMQISTTNTSGTITNWYGIRINAISGNAPATARYPLYILDTGNSYFAGNLGLGQTTPTAVLHLKAGTASASTAPLKFTAGTVNTTPEAGTMEFTNAEDGLTFTAVSTRRQIVLDTATQTLTNKTIQAPLIDYVIEPASDDTYEGEATNDINAGDTIAQWDLTYLDSTSGRWEFADADAVATSGGVLLALAAAAGTDGNPMNVVFRGVVRNDGWTWSGAGKPLYVSTTAGGMTETAPSGASDVIRVVGYTLSDDAIYFNPDNTWVVHT